METVDTGPLDGPMDGRSYRRRIGARDAEVICKLGSDCQCGMEDVSIEKSRPTDGPRPPRTRIDHYMIALVASRLVTSLFYFRSSMTECNGSHDMNTFIFWKGAVPALNTVEMRIGALLP